eukprot:CAMPEP_0205893972 /NCGR_PEP_ID=MMETSP1083-20121108/23575_1 /ASSEMBLY_ACC=CAM_ASM_000430 /TAXON_ID=97485 /ORGANISM="Prymnesium parvum, Strain Texoma1" /LENGTH=124 /DNA_ID=CAMNT_0053258753 /DNA_START=355 /DNA_END=725 /DNA_ORIENTATION=+
MRTIKRSLSPSTPAGCPSRVCGRKDRSDVNGATRLNGISPHTSSEQMLTSFATHILHTRSSSSTLQQRPAGLCGLQKCSSLVRGCASSRSSKTQSITKRICRELSVAPPSRSGTCTNVAPFDRT